MSTEPPPNTNAVLKSINPTLETTKCKCTQYDLLWKNKFEICGLVEYCGCIRSQQLITNKLFIYRAFAAIYCVCILLWNISRYHRHNMNAYFLIYVTQWDALVVTSYFITISIINIKILRYINIHINDAPSLDLNDITLKPNGIISSTNTNINVLFDNDSVLQFLCKLCSILFCICFSVTHIITITNWVLATDYSSYIEDNDDIEKLANDVHLHGVLSVLILIDYSVSSIYLPYNSSIYPFIFISLFITWSIIHFLLKLTDPFGNRYIYFMLNWKYPQTAIPVTLSLIGCVGATHYLSAWIKYKYVLDKWFVRQKNIENIAKTVRTETAQENNDNSTLSAEVDRSVNPSFSPSQLEAVQIESEENKDITAPTEAPKEQQT